MYLLARDCDAEPVVHNVEILYLQRPHNILVQAILKRVTDSLGEEIGQFTAQDLSGFSDEGHLAVLDLWAQFHTEGPVKENVTLKVPSAGLVRTSDTVRISSYSAKRPS